MGRIHTFIPCGDLIVAYVQRFFVVLGTLCVRQLKITLTQTTLSPHETISYGVVFLFNRCRCTVFFVVVGMLPHNAIKKSS